MTFLAESDHMFAEAKTDVERQEILRKRARARVFLVTDGAVEARKAKAETSDDVCASDDAYIAAVAKFEALRAKRDRAEILIDVFRTLEASRRKS